MSFRALVLLGSFLALAACDRGASVFEKGAAAEAAGQIEDARWQYASVFRNFPSSEKAADAKRAYVRLTLDMAAHSLASGDTSSCETRLGEAQPLLEDDADKARFKQIQADERTALLAARQSEEVRDLARKIADLAAVEVKGQRDIARQPAFKWDAFLGPDMTPARRVFVHLGKLDQTERSAFDFGLVKRVGDGRYVLDVVTKTSLGDEAGEWYVQNTTNGWRLVCAQKKDAGECQDPWVGKLVQP